MTAASPSPCTKTNKSAEAEAEKERVESQTAADEEDLGREALLRGDELSAAQHLLIADEAQPDAPGVRLPLYAAMNRLNGLSSVLRGGSGELTRIDVAPKTGYILTVSADGEAVVWNPTKALPIATLGRSGNLSRNPDALAGINDVPNRIAAATFTPDGKRILFASGSAVFLQDVTKGSKVPLNLGHGTPLISAAALSSDGTTVIGTIGRYHGETDATQILAWNSTTGDMISHIKISDTWAVMSVPGSGARAVLVGGQPFKSARQLRVADVATGKTIAEIPIGTYDDPEVSPRGDLILVNRFPPNSPSVVYSAATGAQVAKLSAGGLAATGATWSHSGRYVLSRIGASEALWDTLTWKTVHVWRNSVWDAVAIDAQDSLVASVKGVGTIDIWSVDSGGLLKEFNDGICAEEVAGGPSTAFSHLQFSPDSTLLVNTGGGACATVWNWRRVGQNQLVLTDGDPGHNGILPVVSSMKFSPGGNLAVTSSSDGTATIWNLRSGAAQLRFRKNDAVHGFEVSKAIFVPGGKELVTGDSFDAALWNTASGSLLRQLDFDKHGIVLGDTVRIAVDSRRDRAITVSSNGWGALWDLKTDKQIATLHAKVGAQVRSVAFGPDGSKFLMADASGSVFIFEGLHGTLERKIRASGAPLVTAEIGPYAHRLLTADDLGHITIWSMADGRALIKVNTAAGAPTVNEAHFKPDGGTVAAACGDGKIRTWSATTGQPQLAIAEETLPGELFLPAPLRSDMPMNTNISHGMLHVAYSPDGAFIAGSNETGHVMVWDQKTGKQLLRFEGHTGRVTSLEFSPDGSYLGSSSEDGTARIWDVRMENRNFAELRRKLAEIAERLPR